jgi:ATP-dependent Lon protease
VFCELISIEETSDSDRIISCRVISKAIIKEIQRIEYKNYADVTLISEVPPTPESQSTLELKSIFHGLITSTEGFPKKAKKKVLQSDNILYMSNLVVDILSPDDEEKYNYLQSEDPLYNIAYAINLLLANSLQSRSTEDFESLFDQLRIKIKQDSQQKKSARNSPREKITALPIDEDSKNKLMSEVDRLEKLPPSSMEYHTVKDYLAWIESVPWGVYSNTTPDLNSLIDILNETHHGLDDVKEHILEYLTIEAITKKSQGTVLCFLGNPGTGKTSIAKQIAKACNREIVKIAVGGMSDEAEIRGHRRTYVASRPGRIITGIKTAKTMDPLILFDEVDKIDANKGDPTSALLELFDPEQNSEFIDRYLEVPVDLSKSMFIATANYIENIPPPLRDRMEIIFFRDYSTEEKETIITNFIIPKAKKDYQIDDFNISIDENVISTLADKYRIREIKRKVYKLLRKAAVDIFVKKKEFVKIDNDYVESLKQKKDTKRKIGFS